MDWQEAKLIRAKSGMGKLKSQFIDEIRMLERLLDHEIIVRSITKNNPEVDNLRNQIKELKIKLDDCLRK